eukprot:TRINITY_DN4059_c0_g1_i1.p1 TRINITY_DN4059_c0_g1~~TRINITY_DN4059_c0_g1_i1.p1  ORF type:complete len:161 (-),score=18.90 TRINITY_DN4059_c0_g1_i1:44-526(-)
MKLVFYLLTIFSLVYNVRSREHPNILSKIASHKITTEIHDSISITISSYELKESGEWFEVSWSGVEDPAWEDWIGIMLADSDPKLLTPIKYKWASVDHNYFRTGSGTTKFQLLNHRHDLQVGFFRRGTWDPILVATSQRIKNLNPNEPLQGHIPMKLQLL